MRYHDNRTPLVGQLIQRDRRCPDTVRRYLQPRPLAFQHEDREQDHQKGRQTGGDVRAGKGQLLGSYTGVGFGLGVDETFTATKPQQINSSARPPVFSPVVRA
jgi:hypothetical protein